MTKQLVLVIVNGGLIDYTKAPGSVIVKEIDWDNFKEGNTCPNCGYPEQDGEVELDDEKEPIYLGDLNNCPSCGFPFQADGDEIYNWYIYQGVLDKEDAN